MKAPLILLCVLLTAVQPSCKKEKLDYQHTGELYLDRATDIASALQSVQTGPYNLWQRAQWWTDANVLEAVVDYHRLAGLDYSHNCTAIYNANKNRMLGNFKNLANDDNAWWALAWLKAYDAYGDDKYLHTAQDIFADMTGSWDNHCGGGMNWQKHKHYKNAITNELFIVLAAKLAQRQNTAWQKAYYGDWALRGWQWLQQSGMINHRNLFNDGLDDNCNNNGETEWTYNQGVILGGLDELYQLTGKQGYLDTARTIALAAMDKLADKNGILTEPCGHNCGGDGIMFKGIFVRYLSQLNQHLKDPAIKAFILNNADTAWEKAQNTDHLFTYIWQGPFDDWSGAATGAALDLMTAATVQMR